MSNISASINVSNIDKSKLYQGKKGQYLNVTLIATPTSEYGDYMVVQDVSKEEREAGIKGAILGNAKFFGKKKEAVASGGSALDDEKLAFWTKQFNALSLNGWSRPVLTPKGTGWLKA